MNDLLLVIDMQNVYLPDQPWACETVAHTKANILKLLEKHPKNQTIFTRYIAAEHPVGTWKTYNELNRKINEDPWMNELMDGIKEAAETYLIYDKSTYSSFQVPAIRQAARKADRIILTGGIAHSAYVADYLTKKVRFIAPVEVMAGEFEMEALAAGAARVLSGRETAHRFRDLAKGE